MIKLQTVEQRYEGAQRRLCCIESFLNAPVKVPRYEALVTEAAALRAEINELRHQLPCLCGSGLEYHQCGETQYCG